MILKRYIRSFDNTKIAYNYLKGENRDTIVVVVPGFWMSKDAAVFNELSADLAVKYDVAVIDQRGHGSSGGWYSYTAREHEDINCVIEHFRQLYKKVVLMGFSLGAASSVIAAAKYKNIDGLILVSPPADFEKIENRWYRWPSAREWFFKLGVHMIKLRPGNLFLKKEKPVDLIGNLAPLPILIVHGENDDIIFKHHAEELFAKAKEPKKLRIIKDGLHAEDLYRKSGADFVLVINGFIHDARV